MKVVVRRVVTPDLMRLVMLVGQTQAVIPLRLGLVATLLAMTLQVLVVLTVTVLEQAVRGLVRLVMALVKERVCPDHLPLSLLSHPPLVARVVTTCCQMTRSVSIFFLAVFRSLP